MPISLACRQAYTDLITPQAECGGGRGGCEADRNRQTRQGERRREHARPVGQLCCTIMADLYTLYYKLHLHGHINTVDVYMSCGLTQMNIKAQNKSVFIYDSMYDIFVPD